jgi:hypothetical protein
VLVVSRLEAEMTAHIGLYFPYFHFPSDEWIKLSALYWDKMYRVVPHGYGTFRDTPTVRELSKGKSRFIDILHPEDFYAELDTIKMAFLQLIEHHTKTLQKHYGIENRYSWPDLPYTAINAPEADPRLAYLHISKIEGELRNILLKRGLGTHRTGKGADSQWIGMHPRLANVYMSALAETLASHEPFNANPITNDLTNYFVVGGFTFERLAQTLLENAKITSVVHPINETQGKNKLNCVQEGVQDGPDEKEL